MVLLPSRICPFLPHCAEAFRFFLSESISFFTASGMTSSSSSPFPALFFEGWIFMDLTAHVRDIHTWTFWAPPGVLFPPSLQFSPQSSLIWLVLNMKVHLLLPVLIFSFYKKKKMFGVFTPLNDSTQATRQVYCRGNNCCLTGCSGTPCSNALTTHPFLVFFTVKCFCVHACLLYLCLICSFNK